VLLPLLLLPLVLPLLPPLPLSLLPPLLPPLPLPLPPPLLLLLFRVPFYPHAKLAFFLWLQTKQGHVSELLSVTLLVG
jgi:hypothetical protein